MASRIGPFSVSAAEAAGRAGFRVEQIEITGLKRMDRMSVYAVALDHRPVRFTVRDAAGREIDLHPLDVSPDGSATQAAYEGPRLAYPADCFVRGRIGGVDVPCLSVDQQVAFHRGYEPAARDRHDMARLRERFGVTTAF